MGNVFNCLNSFQVPILEFNRYCVQRCSVLVCLKVATRGGQPDGGTNCSCGDQLFSQGTLPINCLCKDQSFCMLFCGPVSSRTLDLVFSCLTLFRHNIICRKPSGGHIRTNPNTFSFFFIFPHTQTLTQTQTLISASNTKNCTCTMFFCIGGVDLLLFL